MATRPVVAAAATGPGPVRLNGTGILAWWTGRACGDQRRLGLGAPPPDPVPASRPLRRLRQVHGAEVVRCPPDAVGPSEPPQGDALVTGWGGPVLAVLTADCAPVALASTAGGYGAVHAGWRGLLAGVVEAAVGALADFPARDDRGREGSGANRARGREAGAGAGAVVAGLGPCIGPCCYRFSPRDLDAVVARYGDAVVGRTRAGEPALDLPAAVQIALAGCGVRTVVTRWSCTACGGDAYSHRARGEEERQALLVWSEGTGPRPERGSGEVRGGV